ncbi:MAG: hypothetical protein HFG67_04165 [Firmicutes bacterium]|nr:hypothetical protein [Bacillota bacterium]
MTRIWERLNEKIIFTWNYNKQFFIKTAVLVFVFIVVFILFIADRFREEKSDALLSPVSKSENEIIISHEPLYDENGATGISFGADYANRASAPVIYVDVSGAVLSAGVYELPEDSRVFEAVEKAGGLCENADTENINLATKLADGDKLYIPTKDETNTGKTNIGIITDKIIHYAQSGTSFSENGGIININTADANRLTEISGIGPSTAQKIIEYRKTNGNFKSVNELLNVKGIGEKTLAKIKDKLCV